jgi:MOSC domain-containing protein YiiM
MGKFAHGHFGENLTTSGLIETDVKIGDCFRVGQSLLAGNKVGIDYQCIVASGEA